MGADKSDLSNALYGYDFVVATTQASINATMKAFLSSGSEPEVEICYVADEKGVPRQIEYSELLANAHGSDPFTVPGGADPGTDKDLQNLLGARFMVGFKAQIGLPPGYAPSAIPDVVTLGADTSSVTFRLMCSEFVVVQLTPGGGYAPASWMNVSQPAGDAWLFTSKVDLRMFPTSQSAYDKLPPAVQQQIQALAGEPFSVQQLLFDLDNAALESVPTIAGVQPGTALYTVLQADFLGTYFQAMQSQGSPLIGATISLSGADPSPLALTNVDMEVDPLLDSAGAPIPNPTPEQQDLATLNYLCAADNDAPRQPAEFSWNWLEKLDGSDGLLAVNRNTFANYFRSQLEAQISKVCYAPWVRVWLSGIFDQNIHFEWSLTGYQTPTVTLPASGATVLTFHYSGYAMDQAGIKGDMGHMTLAPSLDTSVEFIENKIVITQHLAVYLYLKVLATAAEGNIIDKTITDTYTLAVDQNGRLTSSLTSATVDKSEVPSVSGFLNWFTGVNDLIENVHDWISPFIATNFTDLPVSITQDFVFPAGNTFLFKSVQFSDFQDLTADITYADPTHTHVARLTGDTSDVVTMSLNEGAPA